MKGRYKIREMAPSDVETVAQLCRLFEPVSTTAFLGLERLGAQVFMRKEI